MRPSLRSTRQSHDRGVPPNPTSAQTRISAHILLHTSHTHTSIGAVRAAEGRLPSSAATTRADPRAAHCQGTGAPRLGSPQGGAAGARTPNLRRARAALPQLSYGPSVHTSLPHTPDRSRGRVGAPGLEPGASALSGPRSNQLSYAPVRAGHDLVRTTTPPHAGSLPPEPRTMLPRTNRAEDGARGVPSRAMTRAAHTDRGGGEPPTRTLAVLVQRPCRPLPPHHHPRKDGSVGEGTGTGA